MRGFVCCGNQYTCNGKLLLILWLLLVLRSPCGCKYVLVSVKAFGYWTLFYYIACFVNVYFHGSFNNNVLKKNISLLQQVPVSIIAIIFSFE